MRKITQTIFTLTLISILLTSYSTRLTAQETAVQSDTVQYQEVTLEISGMT